MTTVRYRNVFFKDGMLTNGKGFTDVEYYGTLYQHASQIKNIQEVYDRHLDLFIACNKCASNKYHTFRKIKPNS